MAPSPDPDLLDALDRPLIAIVRGNVFRPHTATWRVACGESSGRRRIRSLIRPDHLRILGVADPFRFGLRRRALAIERSPGPRDALVHLTSTAERGGIA